MLTAKRLYRRQQRKKKASLLARCYQAVAVRVERIHYRATMRRFLKGLLNQAPATLHQAMRQDRPFIAILISGGEVPLIREHLIALHQKGYRFELLEGLDRGDALLLVGGWLPINLLQVSLALSVPLTESEYPLPSYRVERFVVEQGGLMASSDKLYDLYRHCR